MKVGAAEIDVTPPAALQVELCGYAARLQPAVGVLDPIFVRAIFLQDGDQRLLWLIADVIALPQTFVTAFREWAKQALGVDASQLLLSATHTHAAPATISLTGCGRCSENFLAQLRDGMQQATREAMARARTQPCRVKAVQQELALAIDRRGAATAHVDPIATAVGFVRDDGSFIAACLNYPMHPVALSHDNRAISADWPGHASAALSAALPGKPIVLVSNGACGNINPPFQTTEAEKVRELGEQVADAVSQPLLDGAVGDHPLHVAFRTVPLPLEVLSPQEIDAAADAARATGNLDPVWQHALHAAVETWRQTVRHAPRSIDIDLLAARLGPLTMLAVNGEMFSRFTDLVRRKSRAPLFVVAYANAAFGYIPTREAYAEGGYEVERAHFFYNSLRPQPGSLELLADRAAELVAELRAD